ncbi:hypothetical protein OEZ85_000254 [Tetradesmus obliquus]|uniref:Glycosyltransferase 61 catalytic domain-containing protein n=1 Tax=Tetradesmus obliquus TaxID=3088 RepID=A0ABY8UQL2_TETOB|nr:hypothetical protein OEZ85_000254 [Tetradesmus obliquus]
MGQLQQGSKKGAFSRTQPWNMRYRQAAEEAQGSTTARAHDDRVFKASLAPSSSKEQHLTAWLMGAKKSQEANQQHAALLQLHLQHALQEEYSAVQVKVATLSAAGSEGYILSWLNEALAPQTSGCMAGWRAATPVALVNEAFPMFLVLQNHFLQQQQQQQQQQRQQRLQLLATSTLEPVLRSVGDGGYQAASYASLDNSKQRHAAQYSVEPSFFSSAKWWAFRQHVMQLHGVSEATPAAAGTRPLVVLNDKRHGPTGQENRRMILDIDSVAANLSAAYPGCEVRAVRLRDLSWLKQLRLLSRTSVFITTQGSSAFRLVF